MDENAQKLIDEMLEYTSRMTSQYLAGFFDGEGCVSPHKNGSSYSVYVSVTQADVKMLSLISFLYPGELYQTLGGVGKKKCFRLCWHGRTALPFLNAVKDNVIRKRKQVIAAIEIAEMLSQRSGFDACNNPLTDAEKERRKALADVIYEANRA